MSRVQSGLVLIGVGVALNVIGRVLSAVAGQQQGLIGAGLLLIIMLSSVVVGVFGIVRLVIGLATKS
jgi:hypothetical protein